MFTRQKEVIAFQVLIQSWWFLKSLTSLNTDLQICKYLAHSCYIWTKGWFIVRRAEAESPRKSLHDRELNLNSWLNKDRADMFTHENRHITCLPFLTCHKLK